MQAQMTADQLRQQATMYAQQANMGLAGTRNNDGN